MALKACGIALTLAFALLTASIGTAGAVGPGGICGPILHGLCDPGLFCERATAATGSAARGNA